MELPFYLSFKKFEENYYHHLEMWFEEHYNSSEVDFLLRLAEIYKPYLSYSFKGDTLQADGAIEVKNCFFSSFEKYGISFLVDGSARNYETKLSAVSESKTISMMEYAQCILDKVNLYFQKQKISMRENENILDYINDYQIITLKEQNGYCIDYNQHQKVLPFLKVYLPKFGSTVDIALYRNFYFSVVKIADFIDQKLNAVQAFEQSIYSVLKSEAMMKVHMRDHNFLTICN